jgi:hypothetical protein
MSARNAKRVATLLIILGSLSAVGAILGIARGDFTGSIGSIISALIFTGVGVYGRAAVTAEDPPKCRTFGKLMVFVAVLSIVTSLVQVVLAILVFTNYDEEEEARAEARDEEYVSKMTRTVFLAVSIVGLAINMVLCPIFTKKVRLHADIISNSEAGPPPMPQHAGPIGV